MTETLGQLWINLGVKSTVGKDLSSAKSELSSLNGMANSSNSAMSSISSGLKTVGTAAAVAGTVVGTGLVAGGIKATTMFRDFEQAVANAASVTGKVGEAFSQAKDNISAVAMELGQKTVFSSADAADAMYNLASAGYDVSTMTSSDLVPMLNLASGTQYDLADTTSMLASTLSQFGLGFESVNRVVDVFAANCGATQASMEKLSYSMKYVGTIANASGMSIEETNAALGVLYNAGLDGESAGTGLRGVLASLEKPTNKTGKMLKDLGVDLNALNPDTTDLASAMQVLADEGLTTAQVFQIFGRESAPAALALMNNTDQVRELTAQFQNAGGTAQTLADEQLDTLSGSLEALSGSIENVFISVGQSLAPTIRDIAGYLDDAMPSIQEFVVGATEGFIGFVSHLGRSVSSVMVIGSTIADAFGNIFSVFTGNSGGLGKSIADIINGIMGRIAGIILEITPTIQNAVIGIVKFFKDLITALQPTWTNLSSIATNIITIFKELFTGISGPESNTAVTTIAGVVNAITSVLASLTASATAAFQRVLPTVQSIFTTIVTTVQGFIPTLQNIWNSISTAFSNMDLTPTISSIKSAFQSIDIVGIFNSVISTLKGIDFSGIFNSIKSAFETGKSIILGFVNALAPSWNNLKSSFDSIKTIIAEVAPSFVSFFNSLGGAGSSSASSATSLLAGVINILTGAIAGLLRWLADNPKVVEFGLALAGVAIAAGGLVTVLAGVITTLTPIFTAIASGITFVSGLSLSWASLGTVLSVIGTSLFPSLAASISTVASVAIPVLTAAFSALSWAMGTIVYTVIPILVEALSLLVSPVGLIIGSLTLLYIAWTQNWGNIQGVTARAVAEISNHWTKFKAEVGRLPSVASSALVTLKNIFSTAFNGIITAIQNWVSRQQARYTYAMTQLEGLKARTLQKWNEIKAGILIKLNGLITDLQSWVSRQTAKFNTVVSSVTTLKTRFLSAFQEILSGIRTKRNEIVSAIGEIPTKIKNKATEFYNAGKQVVQRLIDGLLEKLQTVKDTVSKITNAASLSGLSSSASKSTSSFASSLVSGIKKAGSSAKVSLSEAASGLKRLMPNSPAKEGPFSTLPNWDAIFIDPLKESISKIGALKNPLSDTLSGLNTQVAPSSIVRSATSSTSYSNTRNRSVINNQNTVTNTFNFRTQGTTTNMTSAIKRATGN